MCEQQYLLITGYGFWGALMEMSQEWVTSMTCVTSLKENFIAWAPKYTFHLHRKMKANKKRVRMGCSQVVRQRFLVTVEKICHSIILLKINEIRDNLLSPFSYLSWVIFGLSRTFPLLSPLNTFQHAYHFLFLSIEEV